MVDSNKIGSLTRTWPTQPVNKDSHKKNKSETSKKDDKNEDTKENKKDPGDTIIDEYV